MFLEYFSLKVFIKFSIKRGISDFLSLRGGGKLSGPDLQGVTERREEEWLQKWIKSPDTMVMTDPIAKELLKEYFVPMSNQGLTDEEVEEIIAYLKFKDSKKQQND